MKRILFPRPPRNTTDHTGNAPTVGPANCIRLISKSIRPRLATEFATSGVSQTTRGYLTWSPFVKDSAKYLEFHVIRVSGPVWSETLIQLGLKLYRT